MAPDSPYAVFLSSLRPPKTKGALLLHDDNMGEPVLVYTGTKPPAPGAAQAGWGDPAKPKTSEKTANAKLTPGKDTSGNRSRMTRRRRWRPKFAVMHNPAQSAMMCSVEPGHGNETALQSRPRTS
jgi:hypothetical protein